MNSNRKDRALKLQILKGIMIVIINDTTRLVAIKKEIKIKGN
jgi:hypothetical protein